MNAKLKELLEKINGDNALKAEVKKLTEGKSKEEIKEAMKKFVVTLGYDPSIIDESDELSEDDLEKVAGGVTAENMCDYTFFLIAYW